MCRPNNTQQGDYLNVNLPKTEPIVFDAAIARKLLNRTDSIRLHAHTYSLTHNLTHGSLKPAGALEFTYQHELHGLNIHADDGKEHSLNRSTLKQLAQFKAYAPAYRYADEGENPFIPYKEPSETPFDEANAHLVFLNERRWASNQVNFIRSLLAEMRWLATFWDTTP